MQGIHDKQTSRQLAAELRGRADTLRWQSESSCSSLMRRAADLIEELDTSLTSISDAADEAAYHFYTWCLTDELYLSVVEMDPIFQLLELTSDRRLEGVES